MSDIGRQRSGAIEDARDGPHGALVAGDFFAELFAARRGDRVVARAATGGRSLPARSDPAFLLEALERGAERSRFDVQRVVRQPVDVLDDRVAVHRLNGERLENKHLQRPLEDVAPGLTGWLRWHGVSSAQPATADR